MEEIDYSGIPAPAANPSEESWEPPPHKYFGPKDAKGKRIPEPVYTHQEYPRTVYSRKDGKIIAKLVRSDEELKAIGSDWTKDLSSLGYIGAPSFEQSLAMKAKADAALEPKTLTVKKAA